MPPLRRMGYRRLDTLLDIAKAGYWVKLTCACGHEAKHNPLVVMEKLARRGGDVRLNRLHSSLKCGNCGGKNFRAEHCQGPEICSR